MSVVKNRLAGVEILSFNGLFAEGDFGGKREGGRGVALLRQVSCTKTNLFFPVPEYRYFVVTFRYAHRTSKENFSQILNSDSQVLFLPPPTSPLLRVFSFYES